MADIQTNTVNLQDFSLSSAWTSQNYDFTSRPTRDSQTFSASYTLNSGAEVLDIMLYMTPSNKNIRGTLTVNGSGKRLTSGDAFVFDMGKSIPSGTVTFEFVASGDTTKSGIETINFTNVHIDIRYKNELATPQLVSNSKSVTPPPRGVYVYDSTKKALYTFDGVTQIQHNNTVSIEESPDKEKKQDYINNAKNEPDKLVIDVVMSDIYGDGATKKKDKYSFKGIPKKAFKKAKKLSKGEGNAIESGLNSRSSGMFRALLDLKESRRAVCVITPQNIYDDMLVSGITANQDSDHQFGWEGQITFQGNAYVKVEKKTRQGQSTTVQVPSPSALVTTGLVMR